MPRLLLGTVATLVVTASIAHADPVSLTAAEAVVVAPTSYLQTGVQIGAVADLFAITGMLDGGHAIAPSLWLHGRIAAGPGGDFDGGNGSVVEMRAGLEGRPCVLEGAVCAMVGADLGFAQASLDHQMSQQHAIGVLRLGLDLGTRAFRVRPGIEMGADAHGRATDANAELGLAYRW